MAKDSCVSCGKTVYRSPTSRPEITCHDCRRAAKTRECPECGVVFYRQVADTACCGQQCAQRRRMRENPPPGWGAPGKMRDCEVCGESFPARTNHGLVQRTCSRECGSAINSRNVRCARGEFSEWRSILPTCGRCGAVAYRGKLARRCRACLDAAKRENWAESTRRRQAEAIVVECEACGTELTQVGKRRRRWCADCAKRHNRHRRRARAYGVEYEPINPLEIYERDGWICHICTDPIRRVPGNEVDIDGWSLDHVIPMVHGGPHLKWNVAASHWGCNVLKADQFFVEVA